MKTIISILIAVLVGLGVAIGGSQGGSTLDGLPVFLLCGILAFAVNWLVYIPANIYQTEKYYDLTGSLTYLTVIAIACLFSGPLDARSALVALMVVIWALRLGSFLFRRISADGKDARFDKIKVNPLRFFLTWTLQGTWVALTAASALVIITTETRLPIDIFAIIGLTMWVAGFAIEIIADNQKSQFRANPKNAGRFITTGLWAWSRHPNYFGEILLWTGITVASLPLLVGWQWVTIISPIFVIFLLTKVSGIPMLAKAGQKKWGDEPEYKDYIQRTPKLVPRPPKA
jgi:steroid 5-alpha reductase family enzyme